MSRLFTSDGQSIRASASASVLPVSMQGWSPLGLLVWSPYFPRDSQESSPATQLKSISSLVLCLLYGPIYTRLLERPQPWQYGPLSTKWCLCFFNTLSRFVTAHPAFMTIKNFSRHWQTSPGEQTALAETKCCGLCTRQTRAVLRRQLQDSVLVWASICLPPPR